MRLSTKVPKGYEKMYNELTPAQKVAVKEAMTEVIKKVVDKLNEVK